MKRNETNSSLDNGLSNTFQYSVIGLSVTKKQYL